MADFDPYSMLMGDDASAEQQARAYAAALRGQRQQADFQGQLGMLASMTGNSLLSKTGAALTGNAQAQEQQASSGQQLLAKAAENRLQRQTQAKHYEDLKSYYQNKSVGVGALDPESVVHLRPDLTEALGGEDVVRSMEPSHLAAAVKAFDAKRGMDYKTDALNSRIGAQNTRSSALERSVAVREKKLAMDVGGRNVPGMEMEDGQVLQPKEAAFGKNMVGNVNKSLGFLKELREDFNKYGPETLSSLGGHVPDAALSRMEGSRARLIEAAMGLQGMNPTIGHQALLQEQLRDPESYKNLDRASYNAQLDSLEKSILDVRKQWAAGHGVKTLRPTPQPVEPGATLDAPAFKLGPNEVLMYSPDGRPHGVDKSEVSDSEKHKWRRG